MDVESDFTAFGRIVYWGVVLGLAFLLIVQPSRGGTHSERAAIGGIVLLALAVGHFLITQRMRRRRDDRPS